MAPERLLGVHVTDMRQSREVAKGRLARALRRNLSRGAKDEGGAVALIFALAIVVLVPLVLGFLDVYTWNEQRTRLQDSLDAAALFAARSDKNTDAEIDALGDKALLANLKLYRGAQLLSSTFRLADNNTRIIASATVQPAALAPAFWAHPPITVGTDVIRNSKNLEVALVLDLTGSMSGSDVGSLKTAANDLIDLVVKDAAEQTPYYSRVALVPWAAAVNVGTAALAAQVRGPVTGTKSITNVAWNASAAVNISGATKSGSNPVTITTSANHGLTTGDYVYIKSVGGMTQINTKIYQITVTATNKFTLNGTSSGTFSNYTSGGNETKCLVSTCDLVVTADAHGYANGDSIFITGVGGITVPNNNVYTVANVNTNTFSLPGTVVASGTYSAATGTSYCMKYSCEYYRFTNPSGATKTYRVSTCVTERTGSYVDTDDPPSTKFMGFYYPALNSSTAPTNNTASYQNPCISPTVVPLSATKADLTAAVNAMAPGNVTQGTTGGQTGTAWGWYMLSPNFSYLFPAGSGTYTAASYSATDTLKVVVLMTDGALNTAFCNGVVSNDSTPSYPSMAPDHINCAATNGDTFTQAKNLCTKMKAAKVIIYTVGYNLAGDTTAQSLMTWCATDAAHQFMPTSGTDLENAFHAIGADINNLRLSK